MSGDPGAVHLLYRLLVAVASALVWRALTTSGPPARRLGTRTGRDAGARVAALGRRGTRGGRERRPARALDAAVREELPEVVDLLVVAAGAGCTAHDAVAAVGRNGAGHIAQALAEVHDDTLRGMRLAVALERRFAPLGDGAQPLRHALVSVAADGVPLGDALVRLADDARAARRRATEELVRRMPVRLVFPLVFCALPALVLMTVVPLAAGAIDSLRG